MNHPTAPITSLADLVSALSEKGPRTLELQTSVACPFSIALPPGFALTGKDKDSCILGFCCRRYSEQPQKYGVNVYQRALTVYNFSGDTWGTVENWLAHAPVVSYGPSGIGFVNFGTVHNFVAERDHHARLGCAGSTNTTAR